MQCLRGYDSSLSNNDMSGKAVGVADPTYSFLVEYKSNSTLCAKTVRIEYLRGIIDQSTIRIFNLIDETTTKATIGGLLLSFICEKRKAKSNGIHLCGGFRFFFLDDAMKKRHHKSDVSTTYGLKRLQNCEDQGSLPVVEWEE